jgi:hypothetical protein
MSMFSASLDAESQITVLKTQRGEIVGLLQEDPENTTLRPLLPQIDKSITQLKDILADTELMAVLKPQASVAQPLGIAAAKPGGVKPPTPSTAGGVLGKFIVPDWVLGRAMPLKIQVRKAKELVETLDLSANVCTVIGRVAELNDIVLDHGSISRQHAAIVNGKPSNLTKEHAHACIIDLGAANGTFVGPNPKNMKRLSPNEIYPLTNGTGIRFGESSRFYIVKLRKRSSSGNPTEAGESEVGEAESVPPAKKTKA